MSGGRRRGFRVPVWPFRRAVQVLVLASLLALPVLGRYSHYLAARQLDRTMEKLEGTVQGRALAATDAVVRVGIPDGEGGVPDRRPRKAILERTREWYGSPWSARVSGVSATDLVAGAESIAASRTVTTALAVSLVLPLLATLLLGRVFCGWVCPMGFLFDMAEKVRWLLRRGLEIRPLEVRFPGSSKYVLLGAGLLLALAVGQPVLQYVYPPAILGRESHGFVAAMFDRADGGLPGLALAGLTGAAVLLLVVVLLEVLVAPRFFCATLCPGGALYSLLGRFRLLRVRRRVDACTDCTLCDVRCPRLLRPMTDGAGQECDNCGVCVDACPTRALGFRIASTSAGYRKDGGTPAAPAPAGAPASRVVAGAAFLLVLLGAVRTAEAHHIMGIPHYAYDENYPQAPVLKLLERVGSLEFQLTGYPGNPAPGERAQVHVYALDTASGRIFPGPLTLLVHRVDAFGSRALAYGPASAELKENLFKFFFTCPEEGNYEITLAFEDAGTTSTLRFPTVVGHPGSPWTALGTFLGLALLFGLAVRSVRIKRARARRLAGAAA